jgi:rare lipoprotein A
LCCPHLSTDLHLRAAPRRGVSRALAVWMAMSFTGLGVQRAFAGTTNGVASWYGEEHRGRLMANGKRFNPDRFTAASWFYPLGAKVRVTLTSPTAPQRSVVVTITDRGPAKEYVRDGRIIDLSHAPFKSLAPPYLGLVSVAVQPADQQPEPSRTPPAATVRPVPTQQPAGQQGSN